MPRRRRFEAPDRPLRTELLSRCAASELEASPDSVGDERLAEAGAHGVLGPPSGAVGRDDHRGSQGAQVVEDPGDERLEDRPVEMEAAHDGVQRAVLGYPSGVVTDVDYACMAAAGNYQEPLFLDVHNEALLVEDQRVRLPAPVHPGLLWGEARLVSGGAGHLAGNQYGAVEQEAGLLLFDYLEASVPGPRGWCWGSQSDLARADSPGGGARTGDG